MGSAADWEADTTEVASAGLPQAAPRLPLGTELGPYRLIGELGTGGMGLLYTAEHRAIGRRLAIKILQPELAKRADIVRRFFDEARSVNAISHPHIVEIFDFVADPGGLNYLVMELLEGRDLQQTRVSEGAFPLARSLRIVAQTAAALGAAHQTGIVHRDIKPENVFLISRGGQPDYVKLLDFGLAKLSETLKGNADRTRAGTVLGTPEYMSPEQAVGASVDARSDIYALGLLLHWLLTDRLPHESRELEPLREARARGNPPLPARSAFGEPLSPALDALVQRCLQPSPSKRFQTMAALEAALAAVGVGGNHPARRGPEVASRPTVKIAAFRAPPVQELTLAPPSNPRASAPTSPGRRALRAGLAPRLELVQPPPPTLAPLRAVAPRASPEAVAGGAAFPWRRTVVALGALGLLGVAAALWR